MASTMVCVDSVCGQCHDTDQIKPNMMELVFPCCEISDALTAAGSSNKENVLRIQLSIFKTKCNTTGHAYLAAYMDM